jgi:sulfide dehydrogenase cytochrome subunit
MKKTWLMGLATLMSASVQASDYNPERTIASGKLLGQGCAACHGTDGREFYEAMPSLAGMSREEFITAMQTFRDGTRPAIIMDRVARGYNDKEIEAMADFFAAQSKTQYAKEGQ